MAARPRNTAEAFRMARQVFGTHSDVSEQLIRIENMPDGCSRILLAAAIFAFTSASRKVRTDMILHYFEATAHPPMEMLTSSEANELERLEREIYGLS